MGACCSQAPEPLPASTKSFARVTDAELQLRITSATLPPSEVSSLLESAHTFAHQCFTRTVEQFLSPSTQPVDGREFSQRIAEAREDAVDGFRGRFRQGTEGEAVPFPLIKAAEEALRLTCGRDSPLFVYCNNYRSFALCNALKRRIIEEELLVTGSPNKAKLLRMYDKSAAGAYATMCRNDLEALIDQSSHLSHAALVLLLKKQTVADQELLKKEKMKAETISMKPVPATFQCTEAMCSTEGDETYSVLQSRLSVLDIIDRLPDDDGDYSPNSLSDDYFTLQGKVVAIGPIKKHRSAEDHPLMLPSPMGEKADFSLKEASCEAQQVKKCRCESPEDDQRISLRDFERTDVSVEGT